MGYKRNEDEFTFEGLIEHKTPKAYLVEMTLGGKYWLPISQVLHIGEPDIDGRREFIVSEWWWGVKTPVED